MHCAAAVHGCDVYLTHFCMVDAALVFTKNQKPAGSSRQR